MTLQDYNALQEVLSELRRQAESVEARIEERLGYIREAQIHLQAIEDLEPEDRKIFSPRRVDAQYKEEIRKTEEEKAFHEERKRELCNKKALVDSQIAKIETVLEHQQKEISLQTKRKKNRYQVLRKHFEDIIERIEKNSASIDRNPIQARQNFAIIAKMLEETVNAMQEDFR